MFLAIEDSCYVSKFDISFEGVGFVIDEVILGFWREAYGAIQIAQF